MKKKYRKDCSELGKVEKNNNNNNTRDLDRRSLEDLGEKAVSRR